MENNQYDEIDEKILQMLAKDGNIPFQEVARACGVSDAVFLFSDAKYFLTPIYNLVIAWYIVYYKVLPKDKSSFGGTDWGLYFCKETHKICKNSLFF